MRQVDEKENNNVFMIVVTPLEAEEDEETDAWEGTVRKIARVTQKSNSKLEKRLAAGQSKF